MKINDKKPYTTKTVVFQNCELMRILKNKTPRETVNGYICKALESYNTKRESESKLLGENIKLLRKL